MSKLKRDLHRALGDLIRAVARAELASRLVFCHAGRHFAMPSQVHAATCACCGYRQAACAEHGGKERAELGVRGHVAWQAGKAGRGYYGTGHADMYWVKNKGGR